MEILSLVALALAVFILTLAAFCLCSFLCAHFHSWLERYMDRKDL